MSTANKLTYLNVTKQKLKQAINNIGGEVTDETTFREYVNQLENAYDNLPKTEYQEGTEVNLGVTSKGKLDYDNGVVGIGQSEQGILPSEYQQVEYIESSGSQYINTQYYANQKTKIIADYYIQPNAEGFIFGARVDSGDANQFGLYYKQDENRYAYRFNGLSVINIYGTVGVKTHAELSTNKYLINNGTIIQDDIQYTGTFLGTLPLYILAQNQGGTATLVSNVKLYSFKILEDNKLIRNMIPCYRISDNVIGMYDTVNNVFYTNAGTGVFGKGANAPAPSTPIEIKYVRGRQLFNKSTITHQILNENGIATDTQDGYFTSDFIEIDRTKQYTKTASGSIRVKLYDSSKNVISTSSFSDIANFSNAQTFSIPYSNARYIRFTMNGDYINSIMLEEGSEAHPYTPYNTIEEVVSGKNIATNVVYVNQKSKYGAVCFPYYTTKINQYYRISFDTENTNLDVYSNQGDNFGLRRISGYSVSCDGTRKNIIMQGLNNQTYDGPALINRLSVASDVAITISNLMIEEIEASNDTEALAYESQTTTYEPYVTPKTYQFSLGDHKFYGIGDYADELIYDVDEDKVYKNEKIGKKEITSSTSITYDTTLTNVSRFRTSISDSENATGDNNAYCNIFINEDGYSLDEQHFYIYNKNMFFFMPNTIAQNLTQLQTWLSSNNMYALYRKTTPTLIEITDTTLHQQVKAWYYAQSLDGTTIIEGNGDLSLLIEVRALKGAA